ncbi:hypothetical protein, partial [Roseomonas elaeocarpi]
MATVSQVTEAVFTARFDNQVTAGADAAAKSMEGFTQALEVTEERVTRATRSTTALVKQFDPVTQAAA